MKIPLIRPVITAETKARVLEVLESGFLTEGEVTRQFEQAVRDYVGCRFAIAVTSCTAGLELALRALGIGPGDEVIVPDYTYPATADVVAIVGATLVIVDICRQTMLIDYEALEQAITPRTKAILPVSLFGNPLDYDRLQGLKERYGVYVVEDAACALGAEYKGRKVGTQADMTVFSFHPRKFITTGEGGVIATNNPEWAEWLNSYKHFGMEVSASRRQAYFKRIGSNYKLSNLLAAVGLSQMARIEELLAKRLALADYYRHLLAQQPLVNLPQTTVHGKHSQQSFGIFVPRRDEVMDYLRQQGIEAQIGTYALHLFPPFAPGENCQLVGDLKNSRYAFDHCLVLPLFYDMTTADQELVVETLKQALL